MFSFVNTNGFPSRRLSPSIWSVPSRPPRNSEAPGEVVVIDTSNYYPQRNGKIEAIERGQIESLWVAEQLGRPIVKAWNAVPAGTFQEKGVPAGTPGRIAIPVAADSDEAKRVGMKLVDESGFDPFDAGSLALASAAGAARLLHRTRD
jgi:8-hydroxy-5-deazaflavin:NADPH oxidoreductase